MKLNQHYFELEENYLFSIIAKKIHEFQEKGLKQKLIRMGIGDVTRPLSEVVVKAMCCAAEELGQKETFRGYGEEQGYLFLREAISGYYTEKECRISPEEIFISDGAKSDLGNILDIFGTENTVLIPDPVYPVYVDTNKMAGRKIIYMEGKIENNFLPLPDETIKADIIYLCSPNNPTGAVYSAEQLKQWVDYAIKNEAVILFDSAYEAFIRNPELPTSIYQIEGAALCAIEFCSLSKTAGFTGTRCGYTVVPKELKRQGFSLRQLWLKRQTTKFNGVPYVVQRGAEAVFSEEGKKEFQKNVDYYMENASILTQFFNEMNIKYVGGENSPYIWFECPGQRGSWEFFDYLLNEAGIAGTPGAGFGKCGEGYFRITAFGSHEDVLSAIERMRSVFARL